MYGPFEVDEYDIISKLHIEIFKNDEELRYSYLSNLCNSISSYLNKLEDNIDIKHSGTYREMMSISYCYLKYLFQLLKTLGYDSLIYNANTYRDINITVGDYYHRVSINAKKEDGYIIKDINIKDMVNISIVNSKDYRYGITIIVSYQDVVDNYVFYRSKDFLNNE